MAEPTNIFYCWVCSFVVVALFHISYNHHVMHRSTVLRPVGSCRVQVFQWSFQGIIQIGSWKHIILFISVSALGGKVEVCMI